MKAIILTRYGSPDDLEYQEVDKPTPDVGEVSIEVHASAANDYELGIMRGKPLFIRAFLGLTKPRLRIMGCDVAGRIEAVGTGVTRFEPGDDVYGDLSDVGFGAFAEYVCAPEHAVEPKPKNLSYEEAATVPHAAGLALQSLRDIAHLRAGQTLLINGAGGGVGTLGIQYAKLHDVEVTGVDSAGKQDFMRSLGCDHVIDYTQEDFTSTGRQYDVILDVKTNRSPFAYSRALNPGGTYVTVGGEMPRLFQIVMLRWWFASTGSRRMRVLALKANRGLTDITELVEAGRIVPSIGKRYPLSDVPEALRMFGESRHTGKIVISVP